MSPEPGRDLGDYIVIRPGRMSGAPTIGHSRITTESMANMAHGLGVEMVMEDYDLTRQQVLLCCWYEWQDADGRTAKGKWARAVKGALGGWGGDAAIDALPDPPRVHACSDS